MKLSPYFAHLRSAYEAEINDMAFDSEGKNILRQRLAQRRKELPFLRQMMASAPEMVAIVFHQGMRFTKPSALDALVSREANALPDWGSLSGVIALEPWAEAIAQDLSKEPHGEAFMVLAAAMEYLFHHTPGQSANEESADQEDEDAESEEEREARAAEEAGADWMAEQGFDRKE